MDHTHNENLCMPATGFFSVHAKAEWVCSETTDIQYTQEEEEEEAEKLFFHSMNVAKKGEQK